MAPDVEVEEAEEHAQPIGIDAWRPMARPTAAKTIAPSTIPGPTMPRYWRREPQAGRRDKQHERQPADQSPRCEKIKRPASARNGIASDGGSFFDSTCTAQIHSALPTRNSVTGQRSIG